MPPTASAGCQDHREADATSPNARRFAAAAGRGTEIRSQSRPRGPERFQRWNRNGV